MATSAAAILLLVSLLISPSMAEIKTPTFSDDSRNLILFETFGFTLSGQVNITISGATVTVAGSASPDLSLIGFFLISDDSLLIASKNPNPNPNPGCALTNPNTIKLFTFADLSPAGDHSSSLSIKTPDEYNLLFANCVPGTAVSMAVRTEMFNARPDGTRDYLSVGQSAVPTIYSMFCLTYFVFLICWIYQVVVKNRLSAHRIHYLMAGLLLVKALNLVFAAEDKHFVRLTGSPHGWDVLFYAFQFLRGVLLFTVIVLIGTGWSFLKPYLQEKEKKVLMVVIPLQVIDNVASIVIDETGPFIRNWVTWNQVFLLIDVICCCAVLVPIVWSIRTLKETSKTDGKAAKNLAKLTLFRQFYVLVIGYLYFTRIVVYALKTIASYKYRWVSVAAEEFASLAFYIFMFYMFRPVERSQYFVLDEEEEEAAELVLREDEFEL